MEATQEAVATTLLVAMGRVDSLDGVVSIHIRSIRGMVEDMARPMAAEGQDATMHRFKAGVNREAMEIGGIPPEVVAVLACT